MAHLFNGIHIENGKYYMDSPAMIYIHKAEEAGEHTHDFIELTYILRGKCIHIIDSVEYPASHGDMLIVHYGQTHQILCDKEIEYVDLLIKPEAMNEYLNICEKGFSLLTLQDFEKLRTLIYDKSQLVHFDSAQQKQIEMLIDLLDDEQKEQGMGSDLMLCCGFNMLFVLLFRKLSLSLRSDTGGLNEKMLTYLREHCAEKITVNEFARQYHYNPSYFSRLFKQYSSKTFTQYLTDCRLEKACALLKTTQLSVDTVIVRCGFSDRTKFFRLFFEKTQKTPLKYRKENKIP